MAGPGLRCFVYFILQGRTRTVDSDRESLPCDIVHDSNGHSINSQNKRTWKWEKRKVNKKQLKENKKKESAKKQARRENAKRKKDVEVEMLQKTEEVLDTLEESE